MPGLHDRTDQVRRTRFQPAAQLDYKADSDRKGTGGQPSGAVFDAMVITADSSPKRVLPKPEVLRRNVVEQIQRLPDEGVVVLHELAQELELRAAWAEFSQGMAEDWMAGKYADLGEAITAARKANREARGE